MRIAIGSDHAGFRYKEMLEAASGRAWTRRVRLRNRLNGAGEPVDYPIFIRPAAEAVARGEFDRGIVLGGSGNGEAIVANRVRGVRCNLCWNTESARLARAHSNANVLALGERLLSQEEAVGILDVWMATAFEGGRHQRRIDLIDGNGE